MLLNGNDGSNKTNAGNISSPIRVDEYNEIVNKINSIFASTRLNAKNLKSMKQFILTKICYGNWDFL